MSDNWFYDDFINEVKSIARPGSGGSVPKPLTYDYMPEGYPSKSVRTETVMEQQTLSFKYMDSVYVATLPVSIGLVEGQTYIVTWDGIIYKCLCKLNGSIEYIGSDQNDFGLLIGDEPFCVMSGNVAAKTDDYEGGYAEHTIGITTVSETVAPMDEEFMPVLTSPNGTKYKLTVDDTGTLSATEVT